jgi:hypothetical protein
LKVLFRCITDILKENLNEKTLRSVKEELINISVRTKGDLSKYAKDAKFTNVE